MRVLRRFRFLVLFVFLIHNDESSSTIIIPTILMAMSGGLLMGKMTLGGLMMMLMAANQQQNGQSFFRNLGTIPPPSGASSLFNTGNSVPLVDSQHIQELIVKRSLRLKRQAEFLNSTMPINATNEGTRTREEILNKETEKPLVIDSNVQYRIMRQVAASDPLSCLPQALCGISSNPPSSQSGFLNDYTYLLQQVLTRDEDIDDLDNTKEDADTINKFDKVKNNNKKINNLVNQSRDKVVNLKLEKNTKNSSKKKGEDSSEEEDEGINKEYEKEDYEIEHLANEEMFEDEPDYLSYAMRDSSKLRPYGDEGPPKRPDDMPHPYEEQDYSGITQSDLNRMTESELDAMLAQINRGGSSPQILQGPGRPIPYGQGQRPTSFLSNILPKISMGLSPGKHDTFGDDPFFSGFTRSLKLNGKQVEVDWKLRLATSEEENMFKEMITRKKNTLKYINEKKKELAELTDPVEKFRIAAEFGERVKSPRQCRALFNNCPFSYTQVLEMISDLRKAVMGEPLTSGTDKTKDTEVNLKSPSDSRLQTSGANNNIINLNSGSGSMMGGVTSIRHVLPSGEKVEINLKMTKTGLSQISSNKKSKPKPSKSTTTMSPLLAMLTNKNKKPQEEDLFDDDAELNSSEDSAHNKKKVINSLESLKATVLAIQKINDVTAKRKKEGKPISYPDVLAELSSSKINSKPTSISSSHVQTTQSTILDPEDKLIAVPNIPDPDLAFLNKLLVQNSRPKRTKKPLKTKAQQTASSLLALSLIKVEDDEVEEDLPSLKPTKGVTIRVNGGRNKTSNTIYKTSPNGKLSASNQQLSTLLQSIKTGKKNRDSKDKVSLENNQDKITKPDEQDELEEDEGTDEADEDEGEHNDNDDVIFGDEENEDGFDGSANNYRKESIKVSSKEADSEERELISVPEKETSAGIIAATQTFNKRKSSMNSRRKPKILYPYESTEFPRFIPL